MNAYPNAPAGATRKTVDRPYFTPARAHAWSMLAASQPNRKVTAYDKEMIESLLAVMELVEAGYQPRLIAVLE